MTTSSGFLVVLLQGVCGQKWAWIWIWDWDWDWIAVASTYIVASPLVAGEICDTIDLRRSVMLADMFGLNGRN